MCFVVYLMFQYQSGGDCIQYWGVGKGRLLLMGLQCAISIMNINLPSYNSDFEKAAAVGIHRLAIHKIVYYFQCSCSHNYPRDVGVNVLAFMDITLHCSFVVVFGEFMSAGICMTEEAMKRKIGKLSFTWIRCTYWIYEFLNNSDSLFLCVWVIKNCVRNKI